MNLKIFENKEFGKVRTMVIKNEPWFVGKDVASILGYKDTSDAIKRHVESEDKLTRCFTDSGQRREMYVINESGLYSLILSSKLPQAKNFKRWITSEVLPSIRKHGVYATEELLNNPDFLIEALKELKKEKEQRKALEKENQEMIPKALFADSVSNSNTSILVGELAKLLKQNGINIGQNRLFQWLRDNNYLISRKGTDYNMPTQYSMELNLFEIKEGVYTNPDGSTRITKTPKVTGKGQIYFVNKFVKESAA